MLEIQKIINDKNKNLSHSKSEINYVVKSYLSNKISHNAMTDWLKAVFNHGMDINETIAYTSSIINSGKKIAFLKGKTGI